MGERINFTVDALHKVKPPITGRIAVYDARTPGLMYVVTSTGSGSFYVYRRGADGRPMRYRLGSFPTMTIDQARRGVATVGGQIAVGIDPRKARLAVKSGETLGALWTHYLNTHAKPHKRSWKNDEDTYDLHLSRWKSRRLVDISQTEVAALHKKIGSENGTYAANRVLALLSTMYSHAGGIGYAGTNPATGVKRYKEEKRERFMDGTELPRFFTALADESNETMRDLFTTLLLSGARKGNVCAMAWSDVSLPNALWVIPAKQAKAGDNIRVHLPAPLVEVLQARKTKAEATESGSPWVFPSHGRTGHIVTPKNAWKSLLKRAGLKNLRIHDLRRTMGSWQAATGASLPIIGKSLGHKNVATTAIYARLNIDPVRVAVDAAVAGMLEAGKTTKKTPRKRHRTQQ